MKQNKIPRNEYIRKPVDKTNPYKYDVLYTNLGQWKYPGQVTRIPSNDITMQGVPYPVYGEDDLGYGQMMYPGMDYTFPGEYVTEIPMGMYGGDPSLPNITGHYPFGGQNTKTHTHMKEGGWLDQYALGGPPVKTNKVLPIYVTDPNDYRLRAYNDSLWLHQNNLKPLPKPKAIVYTNITGIDSNDFPFESQYFKSKKTNIPDKVKKYSNKFPSYNSKNEFNDVIIRPDTDSPYTYDSLGAKPVPNIPTWESRLDKYYPNILANPFTGTSHGYHQPWEDEKDDSYAYYTAARYAKPKQPYILKEPEKSQPVKSKVIKPSMTKDKSGRPIGIIGQTLYQKLSPDDLGVIQKSQLKKTQTIERIVPRKPLLTNEPQELKQSVPVSLPKTLPLDYSKRQWDFNSPMGKTMRYYDAANKLLYSDIIGNGKVQRFYESDYEREKTPMDIPYAEWEKSFQKEEGGALDQYQKGAEKPWGEMTPKERAAYLDKKEALQKQNKKADAWAKKAEEKSREQAKKEYYKDWVAENYDKGAMNPMFQTVAGFTPMGVLPLAMQSGISAINNLGQGNYLEAGIDAAFASPLLKNLKGAKKILPKIGKSNKVFKSEIDWGKWNPETPKYPELINEYNAIEQSTKKAGTWMKNADGTPYKGSPEQFVQEQSSYFKKAYPQGYDETFRGVGSTNTNPDFSKGTDLSYIPPELTGDRGIFTANYDLAKEYAFGTDRNAVKLLNPQSPKGEPGVFNLIHPKGKQIEINTLFDDWQNVDLRKANKAHLQADLNNKKLHLQKMMDNPYASEKSIEKHKKNIDDLQKNIDEFDNRITDPEELSKLRGNVPAIPSTDDIAAYLPKSDLRKITLKNIIDGAPGDVTIVNNKPGNYLKSRIGNVGFFDMTNPNIYKALVPAAIAAGAYQQQEDGGEIEDEFRRGGLYTPPKIKRKAKKYGTSKNIQSSINKLFTRNYDVFGPGGKNIYNPNVYKTGGWLDNVD